MELIRSDRPDLACLITRGFTEGDTEIAFQDVSGQRTWIRYEINKRRSYCQLASEAFITSGV